MQGREFKLIRRELGLSTKEIGRAIGYQGNDNTVSVQVRRMESDQREIPTWIGRLVTMFRMYGVPRSWF